VQPDIRTLTGKDNIALGHSSAAAVLLSSWAGKLFGNKELDYEIIKVPNNLEFLRHCKIITALTMVTLFLIRPIVVMICDSPGAQELVASTDKNFLVYAIIQSFTFTAGIAVVLTGVRMFIGEIVPAFK